VKWAGLEAKLPEREKIKLYAPLLLRELEMVRPKRVIVFGQLTFNGLLRELDIKSPETFGVLNELTLKTGSVHSIQT
jgi:uracil-DNA glycosylase